jgi:D-alanine-D-alanine ligase
MAEHSLKRRKIGVLMGGKSSEREISLRSGKAVMEGLTRRGYNVVSIDPSEDMAAALSREKVEVAFIALHGRWGEDGAPQGLLEMLRIPYTGSGILGSANALDKGLMKMIFQGIGIPTPAYEMFRTAGAVSMAPPYVVKPAREGSTIGISIVRTEREAAKALKEAFRYDRKVLVEKYLKGQEITVGIVNGKVLPVVEVRPHSGFYDYTAKYTKGMTEYIVPAEIPEEVAGRASDVASRVYDAFELSGCVRIDMIVSRRSPSVIDINTSPGMTETSLVPKAWAHLGGTFDSLVETILKGASLKG